MTLIEIVCSVTIALVIVFGVVTVVLLESSMHDVSILERRQDRLESKLYALDKLRNDHCGGRGDDEKETAENPTI